MVHSIPHDFVAKTDLIPSEILHFERDQAEENFSVRGF